MDGTISARDGYPLAATVLGRGSHWVVLNSATGVKRGFYTPFAEYLAERGFSVVSYDYRGIGGSRPHSLRGMKAGMRDWGVLDFKGVLDWVQSQNPERLLGVGHSVGGQVLGMTQGAERIEAFLAIGCQSGYWRHWPFPRRYLLLLLWTAGIPVLSRLMGRFPARRLGLGEDLPSGVAREWAGWCRHAHYYIDGAPDLETYGLRDFRGPMRAYSFWDDPFAPRPSVDAFLSWFTNARTEHRHIGPDDFDVASLGHFSFFRQRFKQTLWKEWADWLEAGGSPVS